MAHDGIAPHTATSGELKPNASGALKHALIRALNKDTDA
jgi:hypothetical protein